MRKLLFASMIGFWILVACGPGESGTDEGTGVDVGYEDVNQPVDNGQDVQPDTARPDLNQPDDGPVDVGQDHGIDTNPGDSVVLPDNGDCLAGDPCDDGNRALGRDMRRVRRMWRRHALHLRRWPGCTDDT